MIAYADVANRIMLARQHGFSVEGTWIESLPPLSARDEIMMMHKEINYKIGIEKKADREDRPPSNRKEKRRQASIDRRKKLK